MTPIPLSLIQAISQSPLLLIPTNPLIQMMPLSQAMSMIQAISQSQLPLIPTHPLIQMTLIPTHPLNRVIPLNPMNPMIPLIRAMSLIQAMSLIRAMSLKLDWVEEHYQLSFGIVRIAMSGELEK
jgi:hypothetical protein